MSLLGPGTFTRRIGSQMELVIPGATNLGLFISAAVVLLLVPGPAVLYIIARAVEQGRKAGLISVLGIHTATLVNVLAAVLGLSAFLVSSVLAFSVIKYTGAAYLIWLGLKKLVGGSGAADENVELPTHGYGRLFRDGFIVNLLNPKTGIFFLAFLPQFVDLSQGHIQAQVIFLGLVYILLGVISDGCYAFAAVAAGNWLKRSCAHVKTQPYISGILLIGLGITAALVGNEGK